jgi:hypothetical protein
MSLNDRTSDDLYHHVRAEQERHLARHAQTREAHDRHAELMRLHELCRDGSTLST